MIVLRNRAPDFTPSQKTAVVREDEDPGFIVADFNAFDDDSNVSIYPSFDK